MDMVYQGLVMTPNGRGYGRDWSLPNDDGFIVAGGIGSLTGDGVSVHPAWWFRRSDGDGGGGGKLPSCWTWYTDENGRDIKGLVSELEEAWER